MACSAMLLDLTLSGLEGQTQDWANFSIRDFEKDFPRLIPLSYTQVGSFWYNMPFPRLTKRKCEKLYSMH